jgi:glycosyltransferase involved in cell wall biosynthesis
MENNHTEMKKPILSVVMPTYNGEKYLNAAIDSVLNQTFKDFELLIINDGSADGSLEIISSYKDKRIRLIDLGENKGISYCRNLGLQEASGEFLAWTDCDDINSPTRFEKQINFLQNNLDFGGCGTWISRFRGDKTFYIAKAFENPEKIKVALIFKPASIPNPAAMLRLSEIRKHRIRYDERLQIGEDYDFIFRCSRHFQFSNIQELLYMYRDSETSIMKKFEDEDSKTFNILKLVYKEVLATLGIAPTEEELHIHYDTCSRKIFTDFQEFKDCYYWLKKLTLANDSNKVYDSKIFNFIVTEQFFFLSKKASIFGLKTLFFFIHKSIINNWIINPKNYFKLAVRCALKYNKFEFRFSKIQTN